MSAATPTFSPAAGSYIGIQTVTISDSTPGATIYYTTNGSAPTTSSTPYTGPITVSATETVEAMATIGGGSNSAVATALYTILGPATLTSPTPRSTLSGASQVFTWSPGNSATHFELWVGTTGAGSSNVYNSGNVTVTTETVNGIPTNGQPVYVRLYSLLNGTWQSSDYTYTAYGSPTLAAMISPAQGSTLAGASQAFTWSPGNSATHFELWVGTTGVGSANVYNSGNVTVTTETVNGIPTNGQPVYVRLYSLINGIWQSNDYTYTASGAPAPAQLISPPPGSVLPGGGGGGASKPLVSVSGVAFTWTPGNIATHFELWLGSTGVGSSNLYNSGNVTVTTETVSGLPTNGETIYARLYSLINGTWQSNDYTYTASGSPTLATMITPNQGSTLASTSQVFTWSPGNTATHFELWVGTTGAGTSNVYNSGNVTVTTETVTGLSNNASTVYVRLYSLINGAWHSNDYTYTSAGVQTPATLTTPTPGSTLPGSSVSFTWSPGNTATHFTLYLGSIGVGSFNLYDSGQVTVTSETVTGLPTNGEKIYARLYWIINGAWQYTDYTYTASSTLPAATPAFSPAAGTYTSTQSVTISDATPGATIYYTANGTTPTTSSAIYSGAITVSGNETVKAIATAPGYLTSAMGSAAYVVGSQVSGNIYLNNVCGSIPPTPAITVTINTPTPQQTTTDSNGHYSFAIVPNGIYTITPSIPAPPTGLSFVFNTPALTNVVVNNGNVLGQDFFVSLGYTVQGSVSYGGPKTGQVYLALINNNCGGGGGEGTSITNAALGSGGAFTIRGVPPGSYTLQATMDNLGYGVPNATNPTGSVSSVTVTNASLTGLSVTLLNPSPSLTGLSGPQLQVITPTDQGVVIDYNPIENNNGVEIPRYYTVEWSADSTFATGVSSATFNASGNNGQVWILNNGTPGISSSFTNTTAYYFRAQGNLTSSQTNWTVWGGSTPASVTVGVNTSYNEVQGTVYIPADITPSGPLYTGYYDQNTGQVYATEISSPTNSPAGNAFTVYVPSGSNYFFFGILDQNNDGMIDATDVTNTQGNGSSSVTISGPLTGQTLTLPDINSTATVTTTYYQGAFPGGVNIGNYLDFEVREGNKLPVSVTLLSGPHVVSPVDLNNVCNGCGSDQFQYNANVTFSTPSVGDIYTFNVTYSDGSTDPAVTAIVTGVLGPNQLVTALSPSVTGTTTPTFTWTYPANAGNYNYQFWMSDNNGNTIWQIPGNNSHSSGFTSTQVPVPPGIVWPTDPTGGGSTPSGSLNDNTQYNWQIQTQDSNGNTAQAGTYFTTN
ncbi:MAG: chitobiase/beta-hexosaminidase C-terminal domain-containing protein [Terracidiphilus sp.]